MSAPQTAKEKKQVGTYKVTPADFADATQYFRELSASEGQTLTLAGAVAEFVAGIAQRQREKKKKK